MFVLAIVGIVANGIAVLRTRRGRSINERVVSLHLLEDVLGWAAVLAGSAVVYFTGWTIIDPILSIAIAIFVIVNVIRNIKQTLPILMQGTPQDVDNERIVAAVLSLENVASVHDLHAWALDERYNVLTLHVVLNNAATMQELSALKAAIRSILRQNAVEHATIEFEEQGSESCAYANCAQTC
jgi:cobalt-zinc-cadmium efflux system protein